MHSSNRVRQKLPVRLVTHGIVAYCKSERLTKRKTNNENELENHHDRPKHGSDSS